jgi:hypothetical protein
MQTMEFMVAITLLVVGGVLSTGVRADEIEAVFPGKEWAKRTPAEVGLDAQELEEFSRFVGGRGCVVRHGYMVYGWGDVSRRADVASACKPFYSHFLFKAVEDAKIESLDEKAVRWEPRLTHINEELGFKDADITWRHFANQTSCYQLVEKPGTAYAYNDWQMALFWETGQGQPYVAPRYAMKSSSSTVCTLFLLTAFSAHATSRASAICPRCCSTAARSTTKTTSCRRRLLTPLWPSPSEELDEQPTGLLGLFLLHPVARAVDHVHTAHVRTGPVLHPFKSARTLITAPVTGT